MNMDIDGVFTVEPTEIFPPKREAHEKWRNPYERAKQELSNGVWVA